MAAGESISYDQALVALRRALQFGMNPSLRGITALCEELGRPQDAFAVVQVTGTNGKTSTTRLTAALLRAEGLRTGLYTSPHLEHYNERIEIDGAPVSDADFALALEAALGAARAARPGEPVGSPSGFTEFELLTAAALWLFRERGVEIAVLEVGLGGRWDATSVASPTVAVITGVGLDHTAVLGTSLEAIAGEKAAIIRPESTPILGPGTDGVDAVFLRRADEVRVHARAVRANIDFSPVGEDLTVRYRTIERPSNPAGATLLEVDGVHSRYPALIVSAPAYQAGNVATAIAATEATLGRALDISRARRALAGVTLPGRFELMRTQPVVIVDGSHNPQAAQVLAEAIRDAFPDSRRRPIVLLGILADKDARGIVEALAPVATGFAVTRSDSPRAMSPDDLAALVTQVTGAPPSHGVFETVADALAALVPEVGDLVVTGSITTAGEARRALLGD